MKKRIGTKIYDTDKGILIIQDFPVKGAGLYKQPKNRTFYIYDGETITPVPFDEAATVIRGAGDPDLLQYLEVKSDTRGCTKLTVTVEHYEKLRRYVATHDISAKSVIESFIDSLPE